MKFDLQGVTFESDQGYPIGVPGENPYYMLEIHYNNPSMVTGKSMFPLGLLLRMKISNKISSTIRG